MIYFKEELDFFAEKIRAIQKDLHNFRIKSVKLKKKIHDLEKQAPEIQQDDHEKHL